MDIKTKPNLVQNDPDIDAWCQDLHFVSMVLGTLHRSISQINLHHGHYAGDEMLLETLIKKVDALYNQIDEARWRI